LLCNTGDYLEPLMAQKRQSKHLERFPEDEAEVLIRGGDR